MTESLDTNIETMLNKKANHANSDLQSRTVKYDFRLKGHSNNISLRRRSKKGGSTYSNMFLDLVYLVGKFDPTFWDKLVSDKQFPEMVKQMQEAYARKSMEPGWSPEQVKQLEEHKKKIEVQTK